MMIALSILLSASVVSGGMLPPPSRLRIEGLLEGVAVISESIPRFSFMHGPVPSGMHGMTQASYRITVSKYASGNPKPLWDSGDVNSMLSNGIEYGGPTLTPFSMYQWTAEWTSSNGNKSAQATAKFETGIMSSKDWKNASWLVGPGSQFRTLINISGDIAFARAYVASPGCHQIYVNGEIPEPNLRGICPWVVSGGNTLADTRYQTHDITTMMNTGMNAVGLLAGNVMYPGTDLLAVIMIESSNGIQRFYTTDSQNWLGTNSFVTEGNAWDTTIDWTMEEPGWATPSFQPGNGWSQAKIGVQTYPRSALQMPLTAALGTVKPTSVQTMQDGSFLYTFPRNFVGTIQISPLPQAAASSSLQVQLGEWLATAPPPPPPPPPAPPAAQCGSVPEHHVLHLGCKQGVIKSVDFASFGTPTGDCTKGFQIDPKCNCKQSVNIVQSMCLGKSDCLIPATTEQFNDDPCVDTAKLLDVKITCNESNFPTVMLKDDPFVPTISGKRQQFENHILRANKTDAIETVFCWHGFQYVRVTPTGSTGFSGALDAIIGIVLHTNMSSTGQLQFFGDGVEGSSRSHSADVLNGINTITLASQRTNVAAYMPTDCPTREKHGWMGDALDASEQALYNFDTEAVHTAFMRTIEDNQGDDGDVPVVIPGGFPKDGSCNDIAWTSAYPQIINMMHTYHGDMRLMKRHWPSLVNYTENLVNHAKSQPQGLAECDQFNDWLCGNAQSCCSNSPSGSSCPVGAEMGSFNYILGLRAMSQMASAMGLTSDSQRYAGLADAATHGFHTAFFNTQMQQYGGDMGAIQSLSTPALFIGSPPTQLYNTVLQTLVNDLVNHTMYTLRVGAVTSKILLNVLSDNGMHDVALQVATGTQEPSWGWWLTQNATTCWESWPEGHGTRNHIFLCGGIGEWMWKHVIGITPAAPGFTQVKVAPQVHGTYGSAGASGKYTSSAGVISSSWMIAESMVSLNVSIPVGTRNGTIVVPKPYKTESVPPSPWCASAGESEKVLVLSCPSGGTISSIDFASFGLPVISGDCSSWVANKSCNADTNFTMKFVEDACLQKKECSVLFNVSAFPADPCPEIKKTLAVRAICSGESASKQVVTASVNADGSAAWDGKQYVGTHPGIMSARDVGDGIAFQVTNGDYKFTSTPASN
eukprot:m.31059 g.31059  ORF g.31059 m.31059 type:complete len:1152 (-) comp8275_c0_seq1:33-3488(-)